MAFWSWLAFGIPNLVNGLASRKTQEDLSRQSKEHQLALSQKQQEQQLKIEELRQSVNWAINQQNAELQRWRFEKEKELQKELAAFNRETQLALAAYQRETTLSLPEANKIFENWPLRIVPSQILDSQHSDERIPLRILISPPDVNFDRFGNLAPNTSIPRVESYLSQKLKDFLDCNYSSDDRVRPTEFLDGAFDSKRYHGGSSIKVLFQMLKSEPTLVLESEIDGDYLNFRFAYWGLGETKPVYKTIFSQMPYRDTVYDSAKARALSWKPARDRLKAQGKNPLTFNEIDTYNLEILEVEEDLQQSGLDVTQLRHKYKLNSEDFKNFFQFLVTYDCLVVGWITDFYYFSHYDVAPLLPELLPNLIEGIPSREAEQEVVRAIVSSYQQAYENLSAERSCWTPELLLQLAQSLAQLEDRSWAKEQVKASVQAWLKLRGVPLPNTNELAPLLEAMKPLLVAEDRNYLERLNQCLVALGEKCVQVNLNLLQAITEPINLETAQSVNQPEEILYRIEVDGKYGYRRDFHTNKLTIQPHKFDDATQVFTEGRAAVKVGDKWGFIDRTGEIIIEPMFERVLIFDNIGKLTGGFSEGLAPVELNNQWGYIDKNGQIIIQYQFHQAFHFSEGLASVKNTEWTSGYIDKTGKLVIDYQFQDGNDFSEGLAAVRLDYKGNWGYIDKSGELVIPDQFDSADDFSHGIAKVTFRGKSGYIDPTGKVVIPFQFDRVYDCIEGMTRVEVDSKYGFFDRIRLLLIQPRFDWADNFSDGLASVKIGNKWSYIDKDGNLICEPQFDKAAKFSEGLAAIQVDDKIGYVDKNGRLAIPPQFKRKFEFTQLWKDYDFSEGLAVVEIDDKFGYINKNGQTVIQPQYSWAGKFVDGIAKVEIGNEQRLIDKKGNFIC